MRKREKSFKKKEKQGMCPWRLTGKVSGNTFGVNENTLGLFKISFGVLHLVPVNSEFSDTKHGG